MTQAGATVELIEGGGGVFEIVRDGELVYSKRKLGRFPSDEEVASIGAGQAAV